MSGVTKDAILGAVVAVVMALGGFQFNLAQDVNTLKYSKANAQSTAERFEKLALQNERITVILDNQTKILESIQVRLDGLESK